MLRQSPPSGTTSLSRRRRKPAAPISPAAVFVLGLLVTLALAWLTGQTVRLRERARFDAAVAQTQAAVEARLDVYIAMLRGVAGLAGVEPELSRAEFAAYVARLHLADHYPGIQGVGISVRLAPGEVPAFEAAMDGVFPGYRVTPDSARQVYHAIMLLEPLDARNRAALGYDMYSNPVRREAMARARDTGEPAASGRVTLVQEIVGRQQAGFLIYVPVYAGNQMPQDEGQRRDLLAAFAYAPFRADDLLQGIFGAVPAQVRIRIHDGTQVESSTLLHDSRVYETVVARRDAPSRLVDTVQFAVAGRPWTMIVEPAPAFSEARRTFYVPLVLALGLLVTIALTTLTRTRARAIAAVGRARDLFSRVLEQAPVAICVMRGQDHVIDVANPFFERLFATDPTGRPMREVLTDGSRDDMLPILDRVYASGMPWVGHSIALGFAQPDRGEERAFFNVLYHPFVVREGRTDGVIAVVVDVTAEVGARRDAESARREAELANRAKSDFLAAMSHELRTPLNAIAGYVQLVEMGVHGPVTTAQREALHRVQRSGSHLLSLINDVLNFAKLEAGRVEFEIEPVELRPLVAEVVHMIEPQLEARNLTCSSDVPAGLTVLADAEKLRQILLNLMSNAVKFTEEGGITVLAEPVARAGEAIVCLRVRDTGVGIPTDRQQGVFDPFVQVNRGLTSTTEGTGLGLAISRDLARGMGADLTVRSAPGGGSTFSIELRPAAPAA